MVHIVFAAVVWIALLGRNNNKNILRISFLILLIFAAIRYAYGNDYMVYYRVHTYIQNGNPSPFGKEIFFTLLNQLCPSFFLMVALTSIAYIYIVYRFMTDNLPSEYIWVGLFILLVNPYIFLMNLSTLRQSLAMLLFILAVGAAYKRNLWLYVLLIAVSAMFHKSSWILLPCYFIADPKPVKKLHVIIVMIAVFAMVFIFDIAKIAQYVVSWFNDANYRHFATQDMQNTVRATLLTSVYFFYVLLNLPKLEGKALTYSKIYLLSPILGIFAYRMSMFTRFQMYFDIFSVVALPQIFIAVQKQGLITVNRRNVLLTFWDCINKYALPILLVLIYCLRYYSFFTNPEWRSFFKYYTIFRVL